MYSHLKLCRRILNDTVVRIDILNWKVDYKLVLYTLWSHLKSIYAEKKRSRGFISKCYFLKWWWNCEWFLFSFSLSIFSIFLQYDIFTCNEVIVSVCFFRGSVWVIHPATQLRVSSVLPSIIEIIVLPFWFHRAWNKVWWQSWFQSISISVRKEETEWEWREEGRRKESTLQRYVSEVIFSASFPKIQK